MLDRKLAPTGFTIDNFEIPEIESFQLSNGIFVHYNHIDDQPIIKLELLFENSSILSLNPAVGGFVARLLKEGTENRSSEEINQTLARCGGFMEAASSLDYFTVTIYALIENLTEILDLTTEILQYSTFPENALDRIKKQKKSEFKVNEKKTSFEADRTFRSSLHGGDTLYGRLTQYDDLETLQRPEILEYYQKVIAHKKFKVYATGEINNHVLKLISKAFGSLVATTLENEIIVAENHHVNNIENEWKDAVQTSLRLGKFMPNRLHEDIHRIALANEILGGYFGSRLMKNIREDKGYSYGIYSRVKHLRNTSYLMVSAEVMKDSRKEAMQEVVGELEKLLSLPVPKEELSVVKNYMLGSFCSHISSPFAATELHKILGKGDLEVEYFYKRFEILETVSSEELMGIYETYFNPDEMLRIMVG